MRIVEKHWKILSEPEMDNSCGDAIRPSACQGPSRSKAGVKLSFHRKTEDGRQKPIPIESALCLFQLHLRRAYPFFSFSPTNTATLSSISRPSARPTAQPSPPLHKPHAATFSQPSSITPSLAEYQLSSTPTVPLRSSILSQRRSDNHLTSLKADCRWWK
jgi:hypothetical protein